MYNTSMLSKHSFCCFVLLKILLDFLSNQILVDKKKHQKQINKQTKATNKQNENTKQNKQQKQTKYISADL